MQKPRSMQTRVALAVTAALIVAGCESAALGPDPLSVPAPVSAAQTSLRPGGMDVDAVLKAMHPGQPVEPGQREQLLTLLETMSKRQAGASLSAGPTRLSPSAERVLREITASPGKSPDLVRMLERLGQEPADPR